MTKSSCRIDVTFFPFDEQRCLQSTSVRGPPVTQTLVVCGPPVYHQCPRSTSDWLNVDRLTQLIFDEQRCPLKFGSWTYDGFQMDLVNLSWSGDLSKYTTSGEWDLVGMPAAR